MLFATAVGLAIYAYSSYFKQEEAEYEFVGKYEYEIQNDSLFNETYLASGSFGFVLGNLPIQGIEIKNFDSLEKNVDYIISLNHPVKAAYVNSDLIDGEAMEHTSRRPLDILQDTRQVEERVFIYRLQPKGKYRLLLP